MTCQWMEGGGAPLEECGGEHPTTTAPCVEEEQPVEGELLGRREEEKGRCEDEGRTCRLVVEQGLCGEEVLGARCCRSCGLGPPPTTSSTSSTPSTSSSPISPKAKDRYDYWLKFQLY